MEPETVSVRRQRGTANDEPTLLAKDQDKRDSDNGRRRLDDSFGSSKYCTLGIHGDDFSKSDVLLNWSLFSAWKVSNNAVLKITLAQESPSWQVSSHRSPIFDEDINETLAEPATEGDGATYVTAFPKPASDLLARYPNLEISLSRIVAEAIGFKNRSRVIVSLVERANYGASHVELVFRDRFLNRADMWQLVIAQLANKTLYRGQRITFMDTIKVQVKMVFRNGRKIASGFFNRDTRPVWRSESSRFMIFIQMSKEMWDFDSEGTGEVMFQRVIAGFLPELFERWRAINARHIVSIILFTRMSCERIGGPKITEYLHATENPADTSPPWKDYYRILVSDLAFDTFSENLHELKREFKHFLRDVTLDLSHHTRKIDARISSVETVSGEPTTAVIGNVLEAINIASSTFAADYIDRSLVHSGLSIVVVSPGTGIFEVNQRKLQLTTEKLIEYGISIDLVCLSQPPLHSVPLFKHKALLSDDGAQSDQFEWSYSIPHWLDVSFWSQNSSLNLHPANRSSAYFNHDTSFVPRVRMYEVQMMGIMDDLSSSIAIPALKLDRTDLSSENSVRDANVSDQSLSAAGGTADSLSGGSSPILSLQRDATSKAHSSFHSSTLLENCGDYDKSAFAGTTRSKEHPVNMDSLNQLTQIVVLNSNGIQENKAVASGNLSRTSNGPALPHEMPAIIHIPDDSVKNHQAVFSKTLSQTMPVLRRSRGLVPPKSLPLTQLFTSPVDIVPGNGSQIGMTESTMSPDTRPSTAVKAPESMTLRRLHDLLPSFSTTIMRPLTPTVQATTPIDIKSRPSATPSYKLIPDAPPQEDLIRPDRQSGVHIRPTPPPDPVTQPLTSPWLTVLNPCDPKQLPADATRRLGRWQHVSPGPITKTAMRWRSLCCPAAVPLTTEVFPTKEELQTDYTSSDYVVDSTTTNIRPREKPVQVLMRKLLGVRLRHNFQIVVGKHVAQALDIPQRADFSVYDPDCLCQNGTTVSLIRGSQVHVIHFLQTDQCHVTVYKRQPKSRGPKIIRDEGAMKTMLSRGYMSRELLFTGYDFVHDWQTIDAFVTGQKLKKSGAFPDRVPFWRTRLVVIPQTGSEPSHRKESIEEDTAEEVRLEGIRRLSLIWQSHSVPQIMGDETHAGVPVPHKSTNPLDIIYSTIHPSAVITTEPQLSSHLIDNRNEHLDVPESQKFSTLTSELPAIASSLQSDRGVTIETRRWHWRIHRECFVGAELITWIIQNFKDISTRDEALKYGNKLMDEGLFVHVNERRRLRDGNYFYHIHPKYKVAGSDAKATWFGRIAASIPSTPFTETGSKGFGTVPGSRSSSMSHASLEHEPVEAVAGARQTVMLSKTMIYGLDPSRKSYQDEYAVLHYDRIASVDDCYHLRVDWLNATPSLIEDSIESWSQLAEKYNLRLVEVPIVEASKIHTIHPFRGPHLIKLSKLPPLNQFRKDVASLSTGSPLYDPFHYHKMILQKFDFVLDLETMADFPQSRDVCYSWGELDYELAQYIRRDGVLTAQITRDGEILLVANRLYTNRSVAMRATARHGNARARVQETLPRPLLQSSISSTTRGKTMTMGVSPVSSPIIHPLGAIPESSESGGSRRPAIVRPEDITYEIEKFCGNEKVLEEFYQEETRKLQRLTPVIMAVDNSNLGRLGTPPTLSLDDGPSLRAVYNKRRGRNSDSSPGKVRGTEG